ncbi:hypothetical protein COU91_01990 [Candidatus Saccharibacteria bacterium CG10_big_fil_rev_8_21_14_0_10_47_8]|nr:MAG: hypothetical protein COU91_01990 [Candidatus Saccharibacteria bacterium CG10_big_fil_rev_8_21_14_0_10_47_8]
MNKYVQFIKAKWFLLGVGLIIGALIILGIRFATYKPEGVHYHATFVVYINGQREKFEGLRYYEETEATACTLEKVETPSERAHMHGNVSDVVHVEDHLVTWGHFFQNIDWIANPDLIKTPERMLQSNTQDKVTFMLNGKVVPDITTQVIKDQDRLLVDFGNSSEQTLQREYKTVPATAQKYNVAQDPAGCSGNKPTTTSDRFKHLF